MNEPEKAAEEAFKSAKSAPGFSAIGWAMKYDVMGNKNGHVYVPGCFKSIQNGITVPFVKMHNRDHEIGSSQLFFVNAGVLAVTLLDNNPIAQLARNFIMNNKMRGLSLDVSARLLETEVLPGGEIYRHINNINNLSLVDRPGCKHAFIFDWHWNHGD